MTNDDMHALARCLVLNEGFTVKTPPAVYVHIGYQYEKAKTPDRARAVANSIRVLVEAEKPDDRAEARRLIEQGRKEAR